MIRVGQGIDVHAFDESRPLILGGVRISDSGGLAGHSDADAVLHAVTDALVRQKALYHMLENRLAAKDAELFGNVAPESGATPGGGDEHSDGHK